MNNCADYIAEAKRALGDPRMSDRELGERLGFAQSTIAGAKSGKMSDAIALAIGTALAKAGVIEHAGEVLLVAHAERDNDPKVRAALMSYAGKVLGLMRAAASGLEAASAANSPAGGDWRKRSVSSAIMRALRGPFSWPVGSRYRTLDRRHVNPV